MSTATARKKASDLVRVDALTSRSLSQLARSTGQRKTAIVRAAVREYEKATFFAGLRCDFEALRGNPSAWAEELRERSAWDATLSDGLAGG